MQKIREKKEENVRELLGSNNEKSFSSKIMKKVLSDSHLQKWKQ